MIIFVFFFFLVFDAFNIFCWNSYLCNLFRLLFITLSIKKLT